MNKLVIVIGLGGTGLKVIRCLRRIMIEPEQIKSLDDYPSAGFFNIDTDTTGVIKPHSTTGDKNYSSDWSILGKPYHLQEKEYIKIDLPVISEMINNNQTRQNIEHWFPYEQLRDIDMATKGNPGAAQIRCLGRLAFYQNYENIKYKFLDLYNSLHMPAGGAETQIYICSSISGGTGAGMFLDMAYCVRYWLGTDTNVNTFGFLVLPKLSANMGPRYFTNAYAALKELNYFSLNQAKNRRDEQFHPIKFSLLNENRNYAIPPFDNCYLVGMSNDTGAQIPLDDAPEMVANRIYLNIDPSFNDAAKGLLQNTHTERLRFLEDPITGYKHAQNFFSFGMASIIYPLDKVKDLITYRLCSHTISGWLSESKESLDFYSEREKYLEECCLTDSFIKGYGNILSGQSTNPIMFSKLRDVIEDIKPNILANNEPCYDIVKRKIYELLNCFMVETDSQKRISLKELYEARSSNIPDAVETVRKKLFNMIQRDFAEPRRGMSFLRRLFAPVDSNNSEQSPGMLHYLEEKSNIYKRNTVDTVELDNEYWNKIKSACAVVDNINQTFSFWKEKKISESLEKVYIQMEEYLEFKVNLEVEAYAARLLKLLKTEVEKIAETVNNIFNELDNLKYRFEEETKRLTRYLTNTDNKWRGNTYILFEKELVDDIYKQIIDQKVPQELERTMSGYDFNRLVNYSSDVSVLKAKLNNSDIYKEAVELVKSAEISRYLGKNIVQMFMSIKEPSERRKILDATYRQANYYFAFNKNERTKGGKDSSYEENANKLRSIVALAGSEEEIPELAELKKELENAGVNLTDDVKIISNPYQMVFLSETSAFPLRLGQDVRVLSEKYDQYLDSHNEPLHISKEFLPPLQELFLSDDGDSIMRIKEHFYIGRVFSWINPEMDRTDHAVKIYYEYRIKGLPRHIFINKTWIESMTVFSGIDDRDLKREPEKYKEIVVAREALAKQVEEFVRKLDSVEKKKYFLIQLRLELEAIEKEVELGKQDPFYSNCRDIIEQIQKKNFYGLNKINWDDLIDWQAVIDEYNKTGKKPDMFVAKNDSVTPVRKLDDGFKNTSLEKPVPSRDLIDYTIECIKSVEGKVTPMVTRLLLIRVKSLNIDKSWHDELVSETIKIAEAKLSSSVPQEEAEEDYRISYKHFLESSGAITLNAREQLDKLKNDLGLSENTALVIEESVSKDLGLPLT